MTRVVQQLLPLSLSFVVSASVFEALQSANPVAA